jgi:hypothetical protein
MNDRLHIYVMVLFSAFVLGVMGYVKFYYLG